MSSELGVEGPAGPGASRNGGEPFPRLPSPPTGRSGRDTASVSAATTRQDGWQNRYKATVVLNDTMAVLVTIAVAHVLDLGTYWTLFGNISPGLGLVAGALIAFCLYIQRAWDVRVLGQGSEEYVRLMRAFATTAVVLGMIGLGLQLAAVRPWVFGLVPMAGVLAAGGRLILRKDLHRRRRAGMCVHAMLAVGTPDSIRDLVHRTRRDFYTGWVITGACTPTGAGVDGAADIEGVEVVGDLDGIAETVRLARYAAVSVSATPGWTPKRLHQLAWDLEGLPTELVVDPGLMEVAGPRLHVAPVDGLPLLRLTKPAFTGFARLVKNTVDKIGAVTLMTVLLPALLLIAVAVACDGGPVFFRQSRVGRHGRAFRMIKFRSMVVDAEARREELLPGNEGSGPLFKMRSDPRITRVGAVIRKYSLDELPQLLNVLGGSMSLVGPRPPLPSEVQTYSRDAQRRLLVRPGLTGLWQISGRSDLSWEESVRLDLRYVENWSLALDAMIIWKTAGAIARGDGAY